MSTSIPELAPEFRLPFRSTGPQVYVVPHATEPDDLDHIPITLADDPIWEAIEDARRGVYAITPPDPPPNSPTARFELPAREGSAKDPAESLRVGNVAHVQRQVRVGKGPCHADDAGRRVPLHRGGLVLIGGTETKPARTLPPLPSPHLVNLRAAIVDQVVRMQRAAAGGCPPTCHGGCQQGRRPCDCLPNVAPAYPQPIANSRTHRHAAWRRVAFVLIAWALVVALAALLTACGGGASDTDPHQCYVNGIAAPATACRPLDQGSPDPIKPIVPPTPTCPASGPCGH